MKQLAIRVAGLLILAATTLAADEPSPSANEATAATRAVNRAQAVS